MTIQIDLYVVVSIALASLLVGVILGAVLFRSASGGGRFLR